MKELGTTPRLLELQALMMLVVLEVSLVLKALTFEYSVLPSPGLQSWVSPAGKQNFQLLSKLTLINPMPKAT